MGRHTFKYICRLFPSLTIEKLKTGNFDSSQTRKLFKDKNLKEVMMDNEAIAWEAFANVIINFVGNH